MTAPEPPASSGVLRHPPTRRRGHSVLCLAPSLSTPDLLASGGDDGAVCLHDLRTSGAGGPAAKLVVDGECDGVGALAWSEAESTLYAAAGPAVVRLDTRVAGDGPTALASAPTLLHTAADDVGGLAYPAPRLVVASDDAGAVTAIQESGPPRPPRAVGLPPLHTNLASCLVSRPSRRGEVISGGFDCLIARWDVEGRRVAGRWEAGACVASARGGGAAPSTSQVLNPPFVHALAAGVSAETPRPLSSLLAAALGDGSVLLLDAEAGASAAPRPGARAVRSRPAGAGVVAPVGVLGALPAHTRAATCVAFHPGSSLPWVVSGGDDGRMVVSDWRAGVRGRGAWAGEVSGEREPVLGQAEHGLRKVQAVGVCQGGAVVCVGDTGRGLVVYGVDG